MQNSSLQHLSICHAYHLRNPYCTHYCCREIRTTVAFETVIDAIVSFVTSRRKAYGVLQCEKNHARFRRDCIHKGAKVILIDALHLKLHLERFRTLMRKIFLLRAYVYLSQRRRNALQFRKCRSNKMYCAVHHVFIFFFPLVFGFLLV